MKKIASIMLTLALAGAMTAFAAAPAFADEVAENETVALTAAVESETDTDTEVAVATKDEASSTVASATSSKADASKATSSKAASSKAASSNTSSKKADKSPKTGDTSALAIAFASTALVMFAAFAEHSSKKKDEE